MTHQPNLGEMARPCVNVLPDALIAETICPLVSWKDRFYVVTQVSRRWRQLVWQSVHNSNTLDLTWCTGEHELDTVVDALASHCSKISPRVSKLAAYQLYGPRVTSTVLSRLMNGVGAGQIKRIDVESKQIDDTAVASLCACTELVQLTLNCVKLTSQALLSIARACSKLEELSLAGCSRVCDEGVIAIANNCPRLRSLDLFMCHRITDRTIVALVIRKSKSVQRVVLDRCLKISGLALRFLIKTHPQLLSLSFANCPRVHDQDLLALRELEPEFPRLEHIDMSGCSSLGDVGAETIIVQNRASLLSLRVRALTTLSSMTFKAISLCTVIQELNLGMCRTLSNEDLARIVASCSELRKLSLQGCVSIDDDGACALATHAKKLQWLSLEFCYNITDDGVGEIVSSCHLLDDLNLKALNQLTSDTFDNLVNRKSPHVPLRRINIGACADFETTLMYASIIKQRYPRARIEWV